MKEYIEKDKAMSVSYGYCHTIDGRCCGPDDVVELYEELKAIPNADVEEVRHGRWIKDEETGDCYCSVCGQGAGWPWYNYCYDCGAKMDGGMDNAAD